MRSANCRAPSSAMAKKIHDRDIFRLPLISVRDDIRSSNCWIRISQTPSAIRACRG